MKCYFHEDAAAEFDEVIDYYEHCRTGLGLEFEHAVYAAIARILQFRMPDRPFRKTTVAVSLPGSLLELYTR